KLTPSLFLKNGSSDSFHPADTAGKLPYLLLGGNATEPSERNDASSRYLSLYAYCNLPTKLRLPSVNELPLASFCSCPPYNNSSRPLAGKLVLKPLNSFDLASNCSTST